MTTQKYDVLVLKLQHGNFYIERTQDLIGTLEKYQHPPYDLQWLQMHPPTHVHRVFLNCKNDDEIKYLRDCMVRGSPFLDPQLSDEDMINARALVIHQHFH